MEHVNAKVLQAYAITSEKRSPMLPDLPTAAEACLSQLTLGALNGLQFPKGTPEPIVKQVNAALSQVLDEPAIRERIVKIGIDPAPPEHRASAWGPFIKTEIAPPAAAGSRVGATVSSEGPRLEKALRIDVDFELERALGLGRVRQPFAQIGREIEAARRLHQQAEAMAAAHHRERRLGGTEHAHVARRAARPPRAGAHSFRSACLSAPETSRLASRPNGG